MVRENRRRYVVFHVLSPDEVGKGLIIKFTKDMTRDLEQAEFDMIKPWFVYYKNQWGIVRTGHRGCAKLVEMISSLDGRILRDGRLRIRIVGVSGTLRSAFYKHIPEKARTDGRYRAVK
jgi:RNase P/RNase MRP subunit POP5